MPGTRQRNALAALRAREAEKRAAQSAADKARAAAERNHGRRAPSLSHTCLLSSCVKEYADAVGDPFKPHAACLPVGICLPSAPLSTFVKGIVTIGTNGYGYVAMQPAGMMATGGGPLKKGVTFTDAAYTPVLTSNQGTAGTTSVDSNTPFAYADIGAGAAGTDEWGFRVYAAGLRVRYTGSELNKAGSVVGLVQPANGGWGASTNIDSILSHDDAHVTDCSRKWHSITWTPVRPDEYEYVTKTSVFDTLESGVGCMLIQISGIAGETYAFEAWAHAEVIGAMARGKAHRMSDPIGGPAVMEAASSEGRGGVENPARAVKDILRNAARNVASYSSTRASAEAERLVTAAGASTVDYLINRVRGTSSAARLEL